MIWTARDDVRLEFVFPRPRATFALPTSTWPGRESQEDGNRIRCATPNSAGSTSPATWAAEAGRSSARVVDNDLATYRDLQCSIGLECVDSDGSRSAIEIGYLFERRLEFTSGYGNMRLDDTAMIRWVCTP